jgi:hypothetical protein
MITPGKNFFTDFNVREQLNCELFSSATAEET